MQKKKVNNSGLTLSRKDENTVSVKRLRINGARTKKNWKGKIECREVTIHVFDAKYLDTLAGLEKQIRAKQNSSMNTLRRRFRRLIIAMGTIISVNL